MNNKKFIIGTICGVLAIGVIYGLYRHTTHKTVQSHAVTQDTAVSLPAKPPLKPVVTTPAEEEKIHFDLYSSTPYDMPLYSIMQISQLSPKAKKTVDKIFEEAQGFYFLKYDKSKNKTFVILQNPISKENTYSRHDIEIAEISEDGTNTLHKVGYTGQHGEVTNPQENHDEWTFDESSNPLKHIAFDDNGDVKFYEIWNYGSNEPVKYEMKDSNGKLISIIKESGEGESNFRREHVFYDNDGKTKMRISVNYDGANISRFTYYDSADDIDSVSIMSEYDENGTKIGEKIYNENYELLNSLKSEYKDGTRTSIHLYNESGKEINKID